jgi:hypothetical protein
MTKLRKVLHALTGEPEMIKAYAASWANIGKEMGAVSADYAAAALAALRNVLDGVYGELSALAESKHAEVAS